MKVSERIKKMRDSMESVNIPTVILADVQQQLIQLEVDVVVALQTARQEAYQAGHTDGYNQRKAGF